MFKPRKTAAWFVVTGIIGIFALQIVMRGGSDELETLEPTRDTLPGVAVAGIHSSQTLAEGDPVSSELLSADLSQRQTAESSPFPLQLLVTDDGGLPIASATVSWSEILDSAGTAGVEQALALIDAAFWGSSDEQGQVAFDEGPPPSSGKPSVLWISRAGYRAAALTLDPGTQWRGMNLTCQLEQAGPLEARVTHVQETPPPGLRIIQAGLGIEDLRIMDRTHPWFRDRVEETLLPEEVLRCFVRAYDCDGNGAASIARGRMPTQLTALASDARSGPHTTRREAQSIELLLAPELQARGTVHSPVADFMPADARIECRWKAELDEQVLGEFPVSQLGTWGPVAIPRREQGEYIFRLLGGDFIPEEKTVSAASVGRILEVSFDGVYGLTQAIRVRGSEGEPIEGARVEAVWQVESGWERSRGWTTDEGRALLPGCPNTTAWIQVSKPGYVRLSQGGVYIVYEEAQEFTLELAGRLEGRVLHAGEPVENFQVFSWDQSPLYRVVHPFSNREDGSFMLDSVPLGRLTLLASSPEYPEGEALTLDLVAGEKANVELELPLGGMGVGRVVDSITGEPIVGATVELLSQFSGRPLGGRGTLVSVDVDGFFEVSGVRLDLPLIRARGPGRIQADTGGTLAPDGKVHFGTIPLSGRQDLLVRVHSSETLAERETYFATSGAFSVPIIEIPPSGELVVPGVAPGNHMAQLVFLDGSSVVQSVWLQPGKDWLVEFDHDPLATIDVLLVPSKQQALPAEASIHVQYRMSTGALVTRNLYVESFQEPTHITHIPSGEILLFATADGDFLQRLASHQFILGPDRSEVIELQLGGKTLEVTAIDAQGLRLEQGVVILDSAQPGDLFNEAVSMPAGGAFVLDAIPVDELLVTVRHAKFGLGFERVRMKNNGVTAVEVQVGGTELQVRVRDGAQNVPGVDVRLIPAGVVTAGFLGKTDEEGLWTFQGIPSRHYSLSLERHGYWPVRHEVEFEGQDLVELAIRQRGDLELTMTLPSGQAVAHQDITLRSVADDKHVRDWLVDRRLATSAVQLVSDEEGRCFARGIPRGAYAWELVRPDGTRVSGECDVPGGAVGEVSIVIPEP